MVGIPERKLNGRKSYRQWLRARKTVSRFCWDLKITEWGKSGEGKVIVQTEVKGRRKCPHCGSSKLYRHGVCRPREVLDTWVNGKKVYFELHRRRWKCRNCKHTFTEGGELVRSRSRLTRPAEAEASWQLKDRNFGQVRRELGVGYSTLRRLMEREIDEEAHLLWLKKCGGLLEKDTTGVCAISKLFPHNLTKSPRSVDNAGSVCKDSSMPQRKASGSFFLLDRAYNLLIPLAVKV